MMLLYVVLGDVMAIGDAMMLKICCNGTFCWLICVWNSLLIDGELIDVVKWLSGSDVIDWVLLEIWVSLIGLLFT